MQNRILHKYSCMQIALDKISTLPSLPPANGKMSLLLPVSAHPLLGGMAPENYLAKAATRCCHLSNPSTNPSASTKHRLPSPRRLISVLRSSNSNETSSQTTLEKGLEESLEFFSFRSWDVPWDWKVTAFVMMPYLMSILFSGFIESAGLKGALRAYSEDMPSQPYGTDEIALRLLADQLLKAVAKLSILYIFVCPYQPFEEDVFCFKLSQPFSVRSGWILWGAGGLVIASCAAFLVEALMSGSHYDQTHKEVESLMQFLPLIGSSNTSTACLFGILGIVAPVCEEILYRGFLMTSLTKWLPLPTSVVISSAVFTLAHHSPGKSLEIFTFGVVLGMVYSQTRNLLTPITMHALWNVGVIVILTILQSGGFEIQKYVLCV